MPVLPIAVVPISVIAIDSLSVHAQHSNNWGRYDPRHASQEPHRWPPSAAESFLMPALLLLFKPRR